MKIFIITPVFPNEINPRSGIFVYEQALILHKIGHEVVVLDAGEYSYKNWLDTSLYKMSIKNYTNIPVISFHTHGLMRTKLPRLYVNLYEQKLQKILQKAIDLYGKPNIFYAHFTFPSGYIACKLGRQFNIPTITLEHGTLMLNNKNHYIAKLLAYTINNSYRFFAVSPELITAIKYLPDKINNIKILNNVLNNKYFYHPKQKKDCFTFFAAGNFYKHKGFTELIDAFQKSFFNNDNVYLRIAGDGPEKSNILAKIANNKNIQLLGILNGDEMINEYIYCDAFALASNLETFGLVYREAMAIGRPVVSTTNAGIKYKWDNKFGYIAESTDSLSTCLTNIYNNIEQFDNKYISDCTIRDFGEQSFINKWIEIENSLRK